ncbi:MAG TPA: hypothetical protein PLC98_17040, partial [Anaerolineales bacterium]|nr:hypothetical protein [Anaerolineales bacterium]
AGKGDVEVAADYIDARVQTSADGVRVAMSDEAHDLETAKVRSSVLTGLITQYAHDTKTDVGEDTDAIETDVTGARSGVSSATAIMDADMARSMGMAETLVSVLQQEIDGKEYHNYVITHFQASYEGGIGDVEVTGDYQGGTTPNMRRKKQDATQINGEVTGFAAGGSFIVPGRGRGDRPYTIPLEPGEHVQITPVDDVRRGGGSGADRAGAQIVVLVLNDQDKERLAYEMANIYAGRA